MTASNQESNGPAIAETLEATLVLPTLRERAREVAVPGQAQEYYRRNTLRWNLERTQQIGLDGLES
jgi:hypothetical protein